MMGPRVLSGLLLLALLAAAPVLASEGSRDRPPNIVLIIGDDHGYPDAGFMGSEIVETPNLDRLAEEGTTFTHAFGSASVCRPALLELLTGMHDRSWSLQRARTLSSLGRWIPPGRDVEHYVTLPRQLARQGYRSFQGGKHWEGDFELAGFDEGTATPVPGPGISKVGWDTFGRPSLSPMTEFLDEVEGDQPFFLFLAPMLPHVPFDPPAELLDRYRGRGLVPLAMYYYANITRLDEVVGRMVDALEERGERDDTLIIYISDNGWEQAPYERHFLGLILGGDRGKSSIHELGFRTPLIFNWPGEVPQRRVLSDLVTFQDLNATILQYAGAPLPPDHRGFDLIARIQGGEQPARDHVIGVQDALRVRESEYIPGRSLVRFETGSFLRTDQWRYVEWLDRGEQALYRIEEDPFERNDVSAEYPELLAPFAERARAWREELAEPAAWIDLMGRITSVDGTPAPGLRVWLEGEAVSGEIARWQVFSDDRGFFRVPNVPAGHYTLSHEIEAQVPNNRWRRAGEEPATDSMEVDLVAWETSPFLWIQIPGEAPPTRANGPRPGTLEIELLSSLGTGTSGLPVHAWGFTRRGFVEQHVLSGPDGFVALDQLPAGFYFVKVTSPGKVRPRGRWQQLRPGATEFLQIELHERPRWRRRNRTAAGST